jgi:hypothetical protein
MWLTRNVGVVRETLARAVNALLTGCGGRIWSHGAIARLLRQTEHCKSGASQGLVLSAHVAVRRQTDAVAVGIANVKRVPGAVLNSEAGLRQPSLPCPEIVHGKGQQMARA